MFIASASTGFQAWFVLAILLGLGLGAFLIVARSGEWD